MSHYWSQQGFDLKVPIHNDFQKSQDDRLAQGVEQLNEQMATVEFKDLLINFIYSHHYLMDIETTDIYYSKPAKAILDFYCQSPENSQLVKQFLVRIIAKYPYHGFKSIKNEIDNIECTKLIIKACQENIINIPSKLQVSLLEYFTLCSYYKRAEPQDQDAELRYYTYYQDKKEKKLIEYQLSNIDDELLEITIFLLKQLCENYKRDEYFKTKLCFFVTCLISRLFDWDIIKLKKSNKLNLVVENFTLLNDHLIAQGNELASVAFSYIKALYKKNLLTPEIVEAMERNIDLNQLSYTSFPVSKRRNMQRELDNIILDFKSKTYYSLDELQEINLKPVDLNYGKSTQAIFWNDYALFQQCTEYQQCEIFIYDQHGKIVNTEPKGFKTAPEVKDLKKQCKIISKMLVEQIHRFEQAMINQRQWVYPFWQDYLLGHGVLSWLVVQFVWKISLKDQTIHGLYDGQHWLNQQGEIIDILPEEVQYLTLWHPAYATITEIQAWQHLLVSRHLTQCFKQVWRAIYTPISTESTEIERKNQYLGFTNIHIQHHVFCSYLESSHWHCQVTQLASITHYKRFSSSESYSEHEIMSQDDFKKPIRHFPVQHITAMLNISINDLNEMILGEIYFCDNKKWKYIDIDDVPKFIFSETIKEIKQMIEHCT